MAAVCELLVSVGAPFALFRVRAVFRPENHDKRNEQPDKEDACKDENRAPRVALHSRDWFGDKGGGKSGEFGGEHSVQDGDDGSADAGNPNEIHPHFASTNLLTHWVTLALAAQKRFGPNRDGVQIRTGLVSEGLYLVSVGGRIDSGY